MTCLASAFANPHPALEPSHAIAAITKRSKVMRQDQIFVANLCGRGDRMTTTCPAHDLRG